MRVFFSGIFSITLLWTSLMLVVFLSGCVAGKQAKVSYNSGMYGSGHGSGQADEYSDRSVDQAAYTREVLMPVLIRINERISAYQGKVQFWQTVTERSSLLLATKSEHVSRCSQQASDLLAGYKKLHDQLLKDQSVVRSRRLLSSSYFSLEKKDITYLEGDCSKIGSGNPSSGSSVPSGVQKQFEKSMQTALEQGDYKRIINEYESVIFAPGQQPGYTIGYIYGTALMKTGRDQEARRMFRSLLTQLHAQDQGQREFVLLQVLADLDFGLGDYTEARSRYEEIIAAYRRLGTRNEWARRQLEILKGAEIPDDEVRAYAGLLLAYLTYA
ncbi:MAG: hypothetical protein DSY80_09425, partial [Desulfocapsa sp.]